MAVEIFTHVYGQSPQEFVKDYEGDSDHWFGKLEDASWTRAKEHAWDVERIKALSQQFVMASHVWDITTASLCSALIVCSLDDDER